MPPERQPKPIRFSTLFFIGFLLIGYPLLNALPAFLSQVPIQELITNRISDLYVPTIIAEWLVFFLMLVTIRLEKENLASIWWRGFSPKNAAIALAFMFFSQGILFAVGAVLPLFGLRVETTYAYLIPRTPAEYWWWVALSVTAGICEESIYRGWLMTRLRCFTKTWTTPVMLSSIAFGIAHAYQGEGNVTLVIVYSLLLSILFLWRRALAPGIIAHALNNLVDALFLSK